MPVGFPTVQRGAALRRGDLSRAAIDPEEPRPLDRRRRRRRLRAEPEVESRSARSSCSKRSARPARRPATTSSSRSTSRPASSGSRPSGNYEFKKSGEPTRDPQGMVDLYVDWCRQYPIISIEDGCAEQDWHGWKLLTKALGDKVQLVGDDVFVTNPAILKKGIDEGIGNALLVKVNQIGTITETLDAMAIAAERRLSLRLVASLRRDRRFDDRRPRRRHRRRARSRPARHREAIASRNTTSCCASKRSSAQPRSTLDELQSSNSHRNTAI